MKVILFIDKENFESSLKLINRGLEKGKKRFWLIEKYTDYLIKQLPPYLKTKDETFELIKIFIYTGKYTSEILYKCRRWAGYEIERLDELIKNEKKLLEDVSKNNLNDEIKNKINNHVKGIKSIFEQKKEDITKYVEKHYRQSLGQKDFFKNMDRLPLIELKTTKLRQGDGKIYQKGVDVNLATDLVHLAHNQAYDVALILGGDSDLKEAVKLVNETLGKLVVVASFYDKNDPLNSNTCPELIKVATQFMNLRDFLEKDILAMSNLMRIKTTE